MQNLYNVVELGHKKAIKYILLAFSLMCMLHIAYTAMNFVQNSSAPMPDGDFGPGVLLADEHFSEVVDALAEKFDPLNDFDADDWRFILVNYENDMPADYKVNLKKISGSYQVDERIYDDLRAMLDAASADGVKMYICSAYRTYNYQKNLLNRKVNYYINLGYSKENAQKIAETIVARPGQSEHNLGLAVDIADASYSTLDSGFEGSKSFAWLKEHCWEYGFILRYTEDKKDLTKIIYEPWHYRYVGKEAAAYMRENALCLEEFVALLH